MSEIERVIPYDLGCLPRSDAPSPMLFQSEADAFLAFDAIGTDVREGEDLRAIVSFSLCRLTRFGYPNDEALGGHPLARCGLGFYGVFEVLGSSWAATLAAHNRVSFPDFQPDYGRHFAITFHDSTFECLASAASVSFHPATSYLPFLEECRRAMDRYV